MKQRTSLLRMAAPFAFILLASSISGAQDPVFEKANEAFRDGRFQEAKESYETLLRTGHNSSTLFYDLGNTWFRLGDLGRAILNYERALALDPRHPEARANLAVVREEARALELENSGPERFAANATESQYVIAASIGLWLALFLGARLYFLKRSSLRFGLLILCCCGLSAAAVFAAYTMETGRHGAALAIITGKNVEAKLATADNAKGVLSLPPGSQIKILSERGDWIYAGLPNGLQGWIPANSAERVRIQKNQA